jgi:predicted esterase
MRSELVELELQGREPLVVSLPADAGSPQPVAVVAHGAGGLATTHCRIWRALMGDRGFIVCPRGRPMYPYAPGEGHGYYFDGHPELGLEIGEALERLRAEFGDRVDLKRPLFVGYSQGASMGSMVLPTHPAKFARAVLMEGGFGQHQEWNVAASRRFHALGAERVLLACGRVPCLELARTTASYMRRAGLEAKVVYAEGAGHSYGETMQRTVKTELAWLMQGDSRW